MGMLSSNPNQPKEASPMLLNVQGAGLETTIALEPGQYVIGRALESEIQLPDAAVSRQHARLFDRDGTWFLEDLGSRHGTEFAGVQLEANKPVELMAGARIVLRPYVLRLSEGNEERTTLFSADDSNEFRLDSVATVPDKELEQLASRRLGLLMDSAAAIQQSTNEESVASAVLDSLLTGTEFGRALLLRPLEDVDRIEMLGSRVRVGSSPEASERPISRTLLRAALAGRVVRLRDEPDIQAAVSIIGSGVQEALCIPVKIGDVIDAFLYLDAAASEGSDGSDTAAFCAAIGRLCGLALANIERVSLAQQQERLVQELQAAQVVQQRMAPTPSGSIDGLAWNVRVLPGTIVAGDLVGTCAHPSGMTMVFLGDVAGKGAAAGLLMAALEARMIAENEHGATPTDLVCNSNRAIMRVTDAAEFITLWTATFDRDAGIVHCVDAGHGYCVHVMSDGSVHQVMIDGGPPVGVVGDFPYESVEVAFGLGERLVIFSDGLAEEPNSEGDMFGFERVIETLSRSNNCAEDVNSLYEALENFAGSRSWSDDVTIISVSYDGTTDSSAS